MSQDELAAKLREYGYKWSKATVWAVENGTRPLKLTEARDLLEVLGYSQENGVSELLRSRTSYDVEHLADLAAHEMTVLNKVGHNFWWINKEMKQIIDGQGETLDDADFTVASNVVAFTEPREVLEDIAAQMNLEITDISFKTKNVTEDMGEDGYQEEKKNGKFSSTTTDE